MAGSSTQDSRVMVLAVTGSIAAYKACDLIRSLTKRGYAVQVLMTTNAERIIGRAALQAISNRPVFNSEWDDEMAHIDLKNMAGVFAVVPATANTIGKLANGIADDLVSSTYLALECPVLVAPAMNPFMYSAPAVQRNLATLAADGVQLIDPAEGEVVCGDTGRGKMAPLEQIETAMIQAFESASIGRESRIV